MCDFIQINTDKIKVITLRIVGPNVVISSDILLNVKKVCNVLGIRSRIIVISDEGGALENRQQGDTTLKRNVSPKRTAAVTPFLRKYLIIADVADKADLGSICARIMSLVPTNQSYSSESTESYSSISIDSTSSISIESNSTISVNSDSSVSTDSSELTTGSSGSDILSSLSYFTDSTGSTDSTDSTQSIQSGESGSTQSGESGSTQSVQSGESESTQSGESESTQSTDSTESTQPVIGSDSTQSIDSDSTQSTESTQSADSTDSTQSVESISDSTQSNHSDSSISYSTYSTASESTISESSVSESTVSLSSQSLSSESTESSASSFVCAAPDVSPQQQTIDSLFGNYIQFTIVAQPNQLNPPQYNINNLPNGLGSYQYPGGDFVIYGVPTDAGNFTIDISAYYPDCSELTTDFQLFLNVTVPCYIVSGTGTQYDDTYLPDVVGYIYYDYNSASTIFNNGPSSQGPRYVFRSVNNPNLAIFWHDTYQMWAISDLTTYNSGPPEGGLFAGNYNGSPPVGNWYSPMYSTYVQDTVCP